MRGVAWTAAVKWSNQLLSWIATLIVARILSPEDFGLVAMATVFLGILTVVSEFGIGSAIVILRDLPSEQVRQLNTAAVLIGAAAVAVSCAAAAPIGQYFHAPQLPVVIIVMSAGFLISSFRSVPYALMQRDMRFKRIALIEAAQSVLMAGTMVLLATLGFRYWTLVAGSILSATLSTLLTLTQCRRGFAWPRLKALMPAISFSQQVLVARLSWYVYSNADFFVAGRVLGKEPLGAYTLAWTLASLPIEKISVLIFNVTPAYFSAIQRDFAELRRNLLRLTEAISLLTVPLTLGLAVVAKDFVPTVLGPRWNQMVPALQLLGAYAAIRSVTPLIPQILGVTGDMAFTMWNSVVAAVVLPIAFYIGSRWGISGIAAAWIVAHPLVLIVPYARVFRRIDLSLRSYLSSLLPAATGACYMCAALLASQGFLGTLTPALRLGVEVGLGAVTYAGGLLLHHRSRAEAVVRALRSLRETRT